MKGIEDFVFTYVGNILIIILTLQIPILIFVNLQQIEIFHFFFNHNGCVAKDYVSFSVYARLWYFGNIINLWNAYTNLLPQPNANKTWKLRIATNFVFIIETMVLHNFCQVLYFCAVFIVKHKYLPPNDFFFSTAHLLNVDVMMLKHESPTNINLQNGTIQGCCIVSHANVNTLLVYFVA